MSRWVTMLVMSVVLVVWAQTCAAGIFSWTDANGVRHFSNVPPPDNAGEVVSMEEQTHDAQADQQRVAVERATIEQQWQRNQAENEAARQAQVQTPLNAPPEEPPPQEEVKREKSAAKRERLIQAGKKLRGESNQPKQ